MLDRENDRAETFTRRAFVIGAGQMGLLCVLGARLAWLQIAQGPQYKTMAENNRINVKLLSPPRGQIVDRFGVPLAINNQDYRVILVPEQTEDMKKALQKLSGMIKLDDRQIQKVINLVKKSAKFTPIEVRDNLKWEEVATIEVNLTDLPGISTEVGEIRTYPFGDATAHMIGYVGAVSKGDLSENDPLLKQPGFRIGKTGIEKALDNDLRGSAGRSEMEVNVVGREVRELRHNAPTTGKRVTLTIDADLQFNMQQRLVATKSASAVIMDVHDGSMYALCSFPSFDPNHFTRGITAERWEELLADPAFPLTNKAIAGQYPPGSTFKMITALAALEAGVVTEHTTAFCPGHFDLGRDKFHCWKKGGHGTVGLLEALAQSCDTYFYKLAIDLGIDRLAEMARRFGLGEKFGFELSEERPGLVPDRAWKRGQYGESWHPGETIVASIGQGYYLATPLQLAVMTARLVNGGYAIRPNIVAYVGDTPRIPESYPKIQVNQRYLDLVCEGMDRVVNAPRGTALGSRLKHPDVVDMGMGGKTGTAQVKRITKQERALGIKNETLPWRFRHHALFVGYAPLHNPRYACAVVVEHGGGGSSAAAPVARDLLTMTLQRDPASAKQVPAAVQARTKGPPPPAKAAPAAGGDGNG